jgi:hypothetical protein
MGKKHPILGTVLPYPPSVVIRPYPCRLQNMAGDKKHGQRGGKLDGHGLVEHIGYSARQLRDKIHTPLRATQFGGDQVGQMLERVQSGGYLEHMAIVGQLFQAKELDEIFSNTKVAALLLQNVPMVKLIKGVPEIAAKGEAISTEDVSDEC